MSFASKPPLASSTFEGCPRRELLQLFGELDGEFMSFAAEHQSGRELAHLPCASVDQFLVAEAERRAPQSRQPVDVFLLPVVE
jgi:hypothetical protein